MKKLTLALAAAVIVLGGTGVQQYSSNKELKIGLLQKQAEIQHNQEIIQQDKILAERDHNTIQELKNQLTVEQEKSQSIQNGLETLQVEVTKLRKQNEALQKEVANKPVSVKPLKSGGTSPRAVKTVRMKIATAYTANDAGMNGKGITATGTKVKEGRTVAVDPSIIPLGSRIQITSASYPEINGVYVAEDTGGAIKGKRLDIYMKSKAKCADFGKRTDVVVTVLTES